MLARAHSHKYLIFFVSAFFKIHFSLVSYVPIVRLCVVLQCRWLLINTHVARSRIICQECVRCASARARARRVCDMIAPCACVSSIHPKIRSRARILHFRALAIFTAAEFHSMSALAQMCVCACINSAAPCAQGR